MENIFKGNAAVGSTGNEKLPDINSYYDVVVTGNLIERKLNKEKYKTLQQNPQVEGMQGAGDMLESIKFNTIIRLPRAAKKSNRHPCQTIRR